MSDIEDNDDISYLSSDGDYSGSDGEASIHNIHQINLPPLFSVNNVDASIFEEGDDESWYSISDSSSGKSLDDQYDDVCINDSSDSSYSNLSDDEIDCLHEDAADMSPMKQCSKNNETNATNDSDVGLHRNLDDQFAGAVRRKSKRSTNQDSTITSNTTAAKQPKRRGSIISNHIIDNKVIWVSFDIEHGGSTCGILQISSVFYVYDESVGVGVEIGRFNEYSRPSMGAIFQQHCCHVHGMYDRNHANLKEARAIIEVWQSFCVRVKTIFDREQYEGFVGVIVAYNGKSCDMDFIFKLVHNNKNTSVLFPSQIEFFLDPYLIIKSQAACPINRNKSNLDDYKLSTVYKFVTEKDLDGAHDAIIDCEGQGHVLFSKQFYRYGNMTHSVSTVADVFKPKLERRTALIAESSYQPHESWKADSNAEEWEVPSQHNFTSATGGASMGPTQAVYTALLTKGQVGTDIEKCFDCLTALFFLLIPISLIGDIVNQSNKYAFQDWVEESPVKNSDGRWKKKKILLACSNTSPNKRKRVAEQATDQWRFSTGLIIAFLGICIYFSGLTSGSNQSPEVLWMSHSNGGYQIPFVRNTMPKNCFKFVRRYIHFCDNSSFVNHREDRLFKIGSVLKRMMGQLQKVWNAGINLSIDEATVLYKGHAIPFVMYNPKKPIKHGIKVSSLCAMYLYLFLFIIIYFYNNNI